METTQREQPTFNMGATFFSAILIVFLATISNIVMSLVYGFIIGFQTRGDQEIISQQIAVFNESLMYAVLFALILGALAFWRARVMGRSSGAATLAQIIVASLIALVLLAVLNLVLGGNSLSAVTIQGGIGLVGIGLGSFLGVRGSHTTST